MSIELRGLDALYRKLGNAVANRTLRPAMEHAVKLVQRDMADYPAQRAGSTYRRTGTLGRRWTTKVSYGSSGVQGKVGNNTKYGPYVQSERFQSRIHRGRWQTDEQVLERDTEKITGLLQDTIDKALEG